MTQVREAFRAPLRLPWRTIQTGAAQLAITETGLRFAVGGVHSGYANAQIDDYTGLARADFPWRPPLRLTVRARAAERIAGTAGFGFWNSPISPLGRVLPVLPAAVWFFYASPPADMPLAYGVPGYGWKAACIDSTQPQALAWAPLAPLVLAANRIPGVERRLWPHVQRALGVSEAPIPPPGPGFREYVIEWNIGSARFLIDGQVVHQAPCAPRGPLGFVAWVDNQWLIATPHGRFGWGVHQVQAAQWMEIGEVQIETPAR
jgi:hypothetical protein